MQIAGEDIRLQEGMKLPFRMHRMLTVAFVQLEHHDF